MDEPTASLSQKEIDMLFALIGQLKKQGISIIYISHRLDEIQRIGDRIYIMRDGAITGEVDRAEEMTQENLVARIVGVSV